MVGELRRGSKGYDGGAMTPKFFATPEALRAWLAANHETKAELLVGFYKRGSRKPSITWPESVDEALCFGWIDGLRRSLSDETYTIRFTPRRATSIWSAINVGRVATLAELGKMTPAGERAFSLRKAHKTGIYSFERSEAAKLTEAQEKKLRGDRAAAEFFDAQPPWYRRTATHWVISAKREETRERRLARLIEDSAAGRTIGPLTRPSGALAASEAGHRAAKETTGTPAKKAAAKPAKKAAAEPAKKSTGASAKKAATATRTRR